LKEGIPIVRSKLNMPQPPAVIMAPERLWRLCSEMQAKNAVFITAPAGYGKTTLLVYALNTCRSWGCRVCWYRLDASDGDLAVFYAHLVEALFPEAEQAWEKARRSLDDCGDIFARHHHLNALICQELWDWQARCPDAKTFIVFDDFQHVLNTPEIADAIRYFIDNLPDNCTIVVSSRWSTGLLTGKHLLSKGNLEISLGDLCFSEDELAAFVEVECGFTPDRSLLRKIMLHTEGWAAGIILVCRMLSQNGADQAGSFLDRAGEKEPFFQYLAAEVLKTADDRLLGFLVKVSLLRDFTAAEAGAIFEDEGTAELLKQCEQKGLFIQIISGPEKTYRFHSLFREFLQQIQPQPLAPPEVRRYHLRTAADYVEHCNFEQAIEHFIACGDVASAVALVTRESARVIAFGDINQLRAWEELGNQAMANINQLYRCLWLRTRENPPGQPSETSRRGTPKLLDEASKALKDLTARPSGMCLQEIGRSVFGAIARECGDYQLAEKNLTAAVSRSKSKGAKQILAGACLHLAKLYYDTGDQVRGEDYLRQAFDLAVDNKYVMFWDLHFPTLVEMAGRCIRSNIQAGYAQTLIARYYGSEAAEFLGRAAALAADDHLQDVVTAFLSRYDRALQLDGIRQQEIPLSGSGGVEWPARISVTLFGKFGITVDGITIPEGEWKTRKIPGILQFLLAHRGREVPRGQLLSVFWPDVDQKSASNSLRSALHEMRKVLRKYGVPLDGEVSLLKEKRGSLEVRTGCLLEVDVDSFLAHLDELKKMPGHINSRGRKKTLLERMVALYRGDFLGGETYEDWAFAEREDLRSLYLWSASELASIYIMDGDNNQAEKLLLKILATDQYNEEACLCLLKLYITTNQRGRAIKLYSSFADRFEKELGIKPDERLALAIRAQQSNDQFSESV